MPGLSKWIFYNLINRKEKIQGRRQALLEQDPSQLIQDQSQEFLLK
jgi:hypothetical protein